MARKMKKFASGDRVMARYDRKIADIKKDYDKALRSGKDKAVAEAKYKQRMADADDDKAKWSGADRTATRAAERTAEQNLSSARRVSRAAPGTSRTSVMDAMAAKNAEPIKTSTDTSSLKKPSIARPGASFKEAFAAARKSGDKTFSWNGKSFSTAVKGEGTTKQKAVSRTGTPAKKDNAPAPAKKDNAPASTKKDNAPAPASNVMRDALASGKPTGPMKGGFVRTGSPGSGSILPPKAAAPRQADTRMGDYATRLEQSAAAKRKIEAGNTSDPNAARIARLKNALGFGSSGDEGVAKALRRSEMIKEQGRAAVAASRAKSDAAAAAAEKKRIEEGKAKARAGNPFYQSYLNKAKGGKVKGYAKGGKIDGCAVRGKTRAKTR